MYLLPFETEVNGTVDIIAVGNTLPQNEFFEMHRIQIDTEDPVKVEVLAVKGPVLGTDISGQVVTSNATEGFYRGLFKAILNPKIASPLRLKVKHVESCADVVDQVDGIVFQKNVYIVLRLTGKGRVSGNLLWMQPEGRRLV